ncbi:MAG: hypothetical protein ABSC03_18055 [Verrucomicrobiota bacterium]|jgi:hypothetical protein
MNCRLATWLSVALNVALLAAGALWWRAHNAPATPPAQTPPPFTRSVRSGPDVATTNDPGTRVAEFHWRQLLAEDFKVYRDNLRAIGCPEATVRDIMLAEINDRFALRRRAILDQLEARFWDVLAVQTTFGRDNQELERMVEPLEKLKQERQELIDDVLGPEPTDQEAMQAQRLRQVETELAWLPAEKRQQILALEADFMKRQQAVADEIQNRADKSWTSQDRQRSAELTRQLEQQRRALLSPEEQSEYDLRRSGTANWAANLYGFEPTEDEWRTVAKLTKEADDARAKIRPAMDPQMMQRYGLAPPPSTPDAPLTAADRDAQLKAIKASQDAAMQAALGDRFADYQRASDGDYQQLMRVTQRLGLGDDVANDVFAMRQAALQQADAVRGNANLPPETQQAALNAIRQQTLQALQQTLGADALPIYQQYGGQWLQQLNQVPGH